MAFEFESFDHPGYRNMTEIPLHSSSDSNSNTSIRLLPESEGNTLSSKSSKDDHLSIVKVQEFDDECGILTEIQSKAKE